MAEYLKVRHKDGKLIIKGEMTSEHIDDTIRQLQALRVKIARTERARRNAACDSAPRRSKESLTFWQKWKRMNARAKEDLKEMIRDTYRCAAEQQ